jgi:hypothetical protein
VGLKRCYKLTSDLWKAFGGLSGRYRTEWGMREKTNRTEDRRYHYKRGGRKMGRE